MVKNIIIDSIKKVEKIYATGEQPILVTCADFNHYVCKYKRSDKPAFKLVTELAGNLLAQKSSFYTSPFKLVKIKREHWPADFQYYKEGIPAIGSQFQENVIDVTTSSLNQIQSGIKELKQLLRIGIFDLWTANEDRNYNNANLLYEMNLGKLISMDYGCLFNNATFDYPLTQLSFNESIIYSDLFRHIKKGINEKDVLKEANEALKEFEKTLQKEIKIDLNLFPETWGVGKDVIRLKLNELKETKWIKETKENYNEIISLMVKEHEDEKFKI